MRFRSQNQPFNSPIGFDLGKIENILISGSKTLDDKVLIVKYDAGRKKYYLIPQDIRTIHGSTSAKFVLGEDDYNYSENFIFSTITEHEFDPTNYGSGSGSSGASVNVDAFIDQTILTLGIDIMSKTQGVISLKGQIFAKHYDNSDAYDYYSFCTGRSVFYENKSFNEIRKRIMYDKYLYLFNSGNVVYVGDKQFEKVNFPNQTDRQYLIPSFATIGNTDTSFSLENSPYIEFEESTDGLYLIHIKCNPFIPNKTKYIKWFGNFELTVTAK